MALKILSGSFRDVGHPHVPPLFDLRARKVFAQTVWSGKKKWGSKLKLNGFKIN